MALELQYTAPFTTEFPSAYHRVAKVDLEDTRACIEVWVYPSAAVRAIEKSEHAAGNITNRTVYKVMILVADMGENTPFTTHFRAPINADDLSGVDAIKTAAYNALKARPDYSDAIDVL